MLDAEERHEWRAGEAGKILKRSVYGTYMSIQNFSPTKPVRRAVAPLKRDVVVEIIEARRRLPTPTALLRL